MARSKRPECYHVWQGMIRRCEGENATDYKNYGGRGITVCAEWRNSYEQFMKDMGPRPTPKHTLERKDTNGNYEPGNCVWATMKEQQNNKRNNRLLTHNGETKTMTQWAESIGITVYAMYQRLERKKMTLEEALTFKIPLYEYDGKSLSIEDWSKEVGIKANTIAKRLEYGWTIEEALTTPVDTSKYRKT